MSNLQVIEKRIASDKDDSILYFNMFANSEFLKAKKFLKYKKGGNIIVEEYSTLIDKKDVFDFLNGGYFVYTICKVYKLTEINFDAHYLVRNYLIEDVAESYKNIKMTATLTVEFEDEIDGKKFVYKLEKESNGRLKCYINYYHNTSYEEARKMLLIKSDFNCLNYRLQFFTKISEEEFNRINKESHLGQIDIGTVYKNTIFNSKGREYHIIPIEKLANISDRDLWDRFFMKQDIDFGDIENCYSSRVEYIQKLLESSNNYYSCLECSSWNYEIPINKVEEKKFVSLTYCSYDFLLKFYKYEDSDYVILNIINFSQNPKLERGKRKFEKFVNSLNITPTKFRFKETI